MKLRRKLLIILCPVSIVSLVGLGFSTWAVASQVSKSMNVNLSVGEVSTGENIDAFGSVTLQTFKMSQYGFEMSDGTYNTVGSLSNPSGGYISVISSININLAKEGIMSLNSSNKMCIVMTINGVSSDNSILSLENVLTVDSSKTYISSQANLSPIQNGITISNGSSIAIRYAVNIGDLNNTNTSFNILVAFSPVSFSIFYNTYKNVENGAGFKVTLGAESL